MENTKNDEVDEDEINNNNMELSQYDENEENNINFIHKIENTPPF